MEPNVETEAEPDALLLTNRCNNKAESLYLPDKQTGREGGEDMQHLPLTEKDAVALGKGAVPTLLEQAGAAMFYATASLLVIFVNKLVLTTKEFPSYFFIAVSQFTSTCLVVIFLHVTGHIEIAQFDAATAKALLPLMVVFILNTVSGLGGTKHINLPMLTVLRRFSILMTMMLEKYMLQSVIDPVVQVSVALMIGGAVVAAWFDLKFEMAGYLLILCNDIFTAAYGVLIKKALNLKIPPISLLFFSSLFGAVVMSLIVYSLPGESEKIVAFEGWRDPTFLVLYACTSFMGCVLQYSIFTCTRVNSALTTAVVGCLKNLVTTLVGMCGMGSDYEFGVLNGVGMAISMGGSFLYSWAKVTKR